MRFLVFLLCFIAVTSPAWADTLFVAAIAEPGGNGQSWNSPYRSINTALQAWNAGDEIWVARGVYTLGEAEATLKNSVKIYGGFSGHETAREGRDWLRRLSIFHAPKEGNSILFLQDCDSSTVVDGIVFENATTSAVRVLSGSPRIFNCQFRNNTSETDAGALLVQGAGRIRIEFSVFENNSSAERGGAVYIDAGAFDDKGFGSFFGQCYFINNTAKYGGAIAYDENLGIVQVASCAFARNTADSIGGAIRSQRSFLYVTNSTFFMNLSNNESSTDGIALSISGGHLQNSILWNGIEDDTRPLLVILKPEADTTKFKSIANGIERDFDFGEYQLNPFFEDEENLAGADNVYGTDDDGLRVTYGSRYRDAGVIDQFVNHRQTDIIGNPRLVGRKVDLGPYEIQRQGRLSPPEVLEKLQTGKMVIFFRHAKTDWNQGDRGPSPECFPGRNLIAEGREQFKSVGEHQRYFGVPVGDALSSPVCRCWETFLIMCGRYEKKDYWASGGSPAVMAARWTELFSIPTNGNRMISSHDAVANIMFNPAGDGELMTTAELMEGDGLIFEPTGDTMQILAHWCSNTWERYNVRFPVEVTSVAQTDWNVEQRTITAVPTPSNDRVRLSGQTDGTVRVYDAFGRIMLSVTTTEFSVAELASGTYFLVGNNATGRLVVTH